MGKTKFLHGQQLVNEIRYSANNIKTRLWIAVPYIGSDKIITSVLGLKWFEDPKISVKLLTDAADLTNFSYSSLKLFIQRGEVKDLLGLHAKIYLIDNNCFITSANLTNTAFSKRYEIGLCLSGKEVEFIKKIFLDWWRKGKPIKSTAVKDILEKRSDSLSKDEKKGVALPTLWKLPPSLNINSETIKKKFLDYPLIIQEYKKFAEEYINIQRIWKNYPIYLEIDTFLNYLYHEAPRRPSHKYKDKPARRLIESRQKAILRKYAKQFAAYLTTEDNINHIKDQIRHHHVIKSTLNKKMINQLNKKSLQRVFDNINALNSYPINKTKILSNNSVSKIKQSLNNLLYGPDELPARMSACSKIKFMGASTINEIVGYYNPNNYPIVNRNSSAGLRFFGFNIPKYR